MGGPQPSSFTGEIRLQHFDVEKADSHTIDHGALTQHLGLGVAPSRQQGTPWSHKHALPSPVRPDTLPRDVRERRGSLDAADLEFALTEAAADDAVGIRGPGPPQFPCRTGCGLLWD